MNDYVAETAARLEKELRGMKDRLQNLAYECEALEKMQWFEGILNHAECAVDCVSEALCELREVQRNAI